MAYKKTFSDVVKEFMELHPGEIETMTPEQLAERTGYSVKIAKDYYTGVEQAKRRQKEMEEEAQIRAAEADEVTYITSSGNARVIYFPLLGEVKTKSRYGRVRRYTRNNERGWGGDHYVLLSSQDAIEIGIYLLGLQPHIRDVIAKKPKIIEPALSDDEPGIDQLQGL